MIFIVALNGMLVNEDLISKLNDGNFFGIKFKSRKLVNKRGEELRNINTGS